MVYNRKYWDPKVPKRISKLISKMVDEDCLWPRGTAEAAAHQLLKEAINFGREAEFREAMRVWKTLRGGGPEVIWQWFNGVFSGGKRANSSRPRHFRRRRS